MTSSPASVSTATLPAPLNLARQPLATPAAVPVAVVLAVLLGATGVIAGRDALISWRAVGGTPWIPPLLDFVSRVSADAAWLAPTAIAVLVVGFALVVVALAPRRRTHRPLTAQGVWLRRRDILTVLADAGRSLPGVDDVRVRGTARRRHITITPNVSAAVDLPGLRSHVSAALATALTPIDSPPKTIVTVQKAPRR